LLESPFLEKGLLTVEHLLELCRRDIADRFEKAALVEPVHPIQSGELHVLESLPRTFLADWLRLVEADDALGQGVIVAVAPGTDRGDAAGLGQASGIADGGY
jgi:hypothetical protein